APDYAINAGGLVNVAQEVVGYDAQKAREKTLKIYDTIYEIADRSSKTGTPTYRVADTLVEEKLGLFSKNRIPAATHRSFLHSARSDGREAGRRATAAVAHASLFASAFDSAPPSPHGLHGLRSHCPGQRRIGVAPGRLRGDEPALGPDDDRGHA